jgi:folate-dependent phosphoribosylglycinamide formyltransferase PurN
MKDRIKVAIITSNHLRHKYYCRTLSEKLDIVGIVAEGKGPATSDFSAFNEADQEVILQHFAGRDTAEKKLLGEDARFPETDIKEVNFNEVNTQEVLDWIIERQPDIILLYGSSIIKDPVLNYYHNKIVNLHLGLSPYYRGSGTNFWPLVYSQPECVGATIHLAVEKVDAGSILHQVRPDAERSDRAHELGTKTIMKAVNDLPAVLEQYVAGNLTALPQKLNEGKVFRNRDFNAEAVRQMWQNFSGGMMEDFLDNYEERYVRYPIITADIPAHQLNN